MASSHVHLVASPFFGGPERQLLGLVRQFAPADRPTVLSFGEGGKAQPLIQALRAEGVVVKELQHNAPHYRLAIREIAAALRNLNARILLCHGYKPDILGYWAARQARIPVAAISRGWTWATWKVRMNERLDRLHLKWMDRVVCVSAGQAIKVKNAGVNPDRVRVIRNAIDVSRFEQIDPGYRDKLGSLFPNPPRLVLGAIGRLSPEKDFRTLISAAAFVVRQCQDVGLAIFGEGPLRPQLARQVQQSGLASKVVLAGFRDDIDRFVPHLSLVVQTSVTEGLPNVLLEAFAAGVPVVATAVGGTPEIVEDGTNGSLVAPGDPQALARAMLALIEAPDRRAAMGQRGRERVTQHFTFVAQARAYRQLFDELLGKTYAGSDWNGKAAAGQHPEGLAAGDGGTGE